MKLKTVSYRKTVQRYDDQGRSLYEPESLELSVEVEDGESSREVLDVLKYQVNNLLGIEVASSEVDNGKEGN